jgi:hypothetical protein
LAHDRVVSEEKNVTEAHTPLPWTFSPWHLEEGPSAVRAPAGHIVCTAASDDDAAFIEKACNNHDALVKALKEIVNLSGYDMDDGKGARAIAREALADMTKNRKSK